MVSEWEIYAMINSNIQRLTFNNMPDYDPALSPDGTKVAFCSDLGNGFEIWVADVKTGKLTQLTFTNKSDEDPCWSPDGQKIAFVSSRSGKSRIYIMDSDGKQTANLTKDEDNEGDD